MALGKKRIRRAVARNRIKRLVWESFRQHANALDGLDIVVLCRCGGDAGNRELLCSLAQHWRRLAAGRDRREAARSPGAPE